MPLRFLYYDGDTVVLPTTLPYVGIYIPIADLPGMDATELASTEGESRKQGKVIYSLIQKIHGYLQSNLSSLSLSSKVSNPTIVSSSLISQTYKVIVDYLVDINLGLVTMIKPASTGVFSGIGSFSLTSVFPNCVKITDTSTEKATIESEGAGVLISTEDLSPYGFFNDVDGSNLTTLNITGDNRYCIASLIHCICDGNITIRSTSSAAGITSVSISNSQVVVIPQTYYTNSNPVTNISSSDLDKLSIIRREYGITFELSLEPSSLEINNTTT